MSPRFAAPILVLAGLACAANADYFSFASDSNPDGPTFLGGRQVLSRFRDGLPVDPSGSVTTNLLWDADEDGPNPAILIPSSFRFQGDFTHHVVQNVLGVFINSYTTTGFCEFRSGDALVLRIDFTSAVFTSVSGAANLWGSTATLQDQSRTDSGVQFTAGPRLGGANFTDRPGDFAFTLTNLHRTGDGAVELNAEGNPTAEWRSEGSFSAHVVPAPASLALLTLGGLAASRRRR